MEKACRRCLLWELEDSDHTRHIYEYIASLPEDVKAEEAVAKGRLEACRSCDCLVNGMCKLCGCYVEVRAAKKGQSCPNPEPLW